MRVFIVVFIVLFSTVSMLANASGFGTQLEIQLKRVENEPMLVIEEYENVIVKNDFAQTSLKQEEIFYLLSQAYYSVLMPDHALKYAQKTYELVNEKDSPWFFHQVLIDLSLAYELTGQASTARPLAEKAVSWAIQQNDFVLLQKGLVAKGLNELTLGEYDVALSSFTQAYSIAQEQNNTLAPGDMAYYIALVHEYTGQNERAIVYFQQASEYYNSVSEKVKYSDALYGLARAYKHSGNTERALALFDESIQLSVEMNDQQGQAYTFKELSGIYLQQENVEKAHLSLVKALQLFTSVNNPYMLAEVNKQLAEIAKKRESIFHAIALTDIALSHTNSDSLKPHYISLMLLKGDLLAEVQQYKDAYHSTRVAFVEQQKFDSKRNDETYERLSAELELSQKDNENKLLSTENAKVNIELESNKQQSYILLLLVLLLLTIAFATIYLYVQSKRVQRKLNSLANSDPLTKLSNRRSAFETLRLQLKLAKREKFELSLALVDLDNFKQINDKYGHPVGDKILLAFAELATSMFRASDHIARIGGEEFLFIFPYTSKLQAQEIMISFSDFLRHHEKITEIINEPLTCSVGISDAATFETELDAISAADKAMYRAKSAGRDAIVIDSN